MPDPGRTPQLSDSKPSEWTVHSRRAIVQDRWLSLHAERVTTTRGVVLDPFYVLDEHDWACVVPVLSDGRLVVVEQYRHGAQRVTWELPAGDLDEGEDPAAAALRELNEETGYVATAAPVDLGALWPEPARNRARGYCFAVAVAARPHAQQTDASEDICVVTLDHAEVDAAIADGRFAHAVHVAAVLLARARGVLP